MEVEKNFIVSAVTSLAQSVSEKYRNVLINASESMPLSSDTVAWCFDLIMALIRQKTLLKLSVCSYFSLAVGESMAVAPVAQMMFCALR